MIRLFLSLCIVLGLFSFAAEAELKWEVVQPFKFLRFESDHRIHELAFEQASTKPKFKSNRVSLMESLLNDSRWWSTPLPNNKETPLNHVRNIRTKLEKKRGKLQLDPRLGWGSFLKTDHRPHRGTCWNAAKQTYAGCESEIGQILGKNDYAAPRGHIVKITFSGMQSGSCNFELKGKEKGKGLFFGFVPKYPKPKDIAKMKKSGVRCSKPIYARLAYKSSYKVAVSSSNGNQADSIEIKVKDYVIVSMGDSYASGEGNPDVPVLLDPKLTITPAYDLNGKKIDNYGVPRRRGLFNGAIQKGSSARWIDRRCHRSIYSPHTRAAIALALSGSRHHAITYLTFACSGAEITDGLFWAQDGQECVDAHAVIEPQISEVIKALGDRRDRGKYSNFGQNLYNRGFLHSSDRFLRGLLRYPSHGSRRNKKEFRRINKLCDSWPGKHPFSKKVPLRRQRLARQIDILMLSIGGNDLGFSQLIAKATINPKLFDIKLIGDALNKIAEFKAVSKTKLNRRLDRHLAPRFSMLKRAINSKLEISQADAKRVLFTLYPTPVFDQKGNYCKTSRKGMTSSSLLKIIGPENSASNFAVDDVQAYANRLETKLRGFARTGNWTVVDSHLTKFRKHGICATGKSTRNVPTANFFDLPRKKSGSGWKKNASQSFDPTKDFYPYAPRARYFRTFNDAYLLVQHFKNDAYKKPPVRTAKSTYLAYRSLGGVFHPTAEANAVTADALYCAAAKQLFTKPEDQSTKCN